MIANNIGYKVDEKISRMAEAGHQLAIIREQLAELAKPGVTLIQIDQLAERLITDFGAEPAFKRVKGYHWATCINVNSGVVHGIPNVYVIKLGDTVSIDVGMYYKGYNTDTSVTVEAGGKSPKIQAFLAAGKKALKLGISQAKPGNRVWHISNAMQTEIESAGYSVVTELTGHGIGKQLHDSPLIPCLAECPPEGTPKLMPGQTLAIEIIYTMGEPALYTEADGWTISTQDGRIAGLFEETIAITEKGPLILTK